jgi:hypothetical protein
MFAPPICRRRWAGQRFSVPLAPTKTAAAQRTSQRAERAIKQSAIRSDQYCAPLSWTSERADTLSVCERARKAAASQRNPQRAERAIRARGEQLNTALAP